MIFYLNRNAKLIIFKELILGNIIRKDGDGDTKEKKKIETW